MTSTDAVTLQAGVVYLSPTGRRCRLCTRQSQKPRQSEATLIYDLRSGAAPSSPFADGFALSKGNWYLLRRAP